MNCSPTIAIALLLLSLTGGMFLLYKTQKESLSIFFRVVAWFVIVVSICSMICCAMRCVVHGCLRREECREMSQCPMEMGGYGMKHGGMHKRMIIFRGEDGSECSMMGSGCCRENRGCEEGGENECCEKYGAHECKMGGDQKCEMKMEVRKDTVVSKKK